jgi:RNA polymerase sigma factor (sigma-70 family)
MERTVPPLAGATPRAAPVEIERLLARAVSQAEGLARNHGASPMTAKDIAQNVGIDIWQEWSDDPKAFDMARPLGARVMPRVLRRLRDYRRESQRRLSRDAVFLTQQDRAHSAESELEESTARDLLWAAVRRLLADMPEARREVFFLIYQNDASYEDVSRARGITVKTARVHCHEALQSLRGPYAHTLRALL